MWCFLPFFGVIFGVFFWYFCGVFLAFFGAYWHFCRDFVAFLWCFCVAVVVFFGACSAFFCMCFLRFFGVLEAKNITVFKQEVSLISKKWNQFRAPLLYRNTPFFPHHSVGVMRVVLPNFPSRKIRRSDDQWPPLASWGNWGKSFPRKKVKQHGFSASG